MTDPMSFFSENVDAWGAAEWFDRLAKAVAEHDKAIVAGHEMTAATYRNIMISSAMRLARDHGDDVRKALSPQTRAGPTLRRAPERGGGQVSDLGNHINCPCTTFEQDESCPVGFPSLLCSVCDGLGVATIDDVTALAAEMLKVADQVGELEDPFAAWESIELIKSERERILAPKQSFTWSDLPGGSKRAIVTELQKARADFMISDFEVAERIVTAFDALIKAESSILSAIDLEATKAEIAAKEEKRAEQWRMRREAEGSRDAARAAADSLRIERDALRIAISDVLEGWDFWEVNPHDREPPRGAIRLARAALNASEREA